MLTPTELKIMSDLSIVAHDYALNADFARRFNNAVLTLKRFYLLGRRSSEDSRRSVQSASADLQPLLKSLVAALEGPSSRSSEAQVKIPADVIESIRSRVKAEVPEVVAQLKSVIENLSSGTPAQQTSFAALDRVCESADATASAAFRRLRRI